MKFNQWLSRGLLAVAMAGSLALGMSGAQARTSGPAMRDAGAANVVAESSLPREAQQTLAAIRRGGPYAYAKDGVVFGNYEKRLPKQRRGYYHEYTVRTPGVRNRGARRIICGGNQQAARECYYTDDHYNTFRRIEE